MDYTNTFCHLMNFEIKKDENYDDYDFISWKKRWKDRLKINNNDPKKYIRLMRNSNPLVIPRNHKVEEALKEANENNLEVMNKLLSILTKSYENQKNIEDFQSPSNTKEYQTFCGT